MFEHDLAKYKLGACISVLGREFFKLSNDKLYQCVFTIGSRIIFKDFNRNIKLCGFFSLMTFCLSFWI